MERQMTRNEIEKISAVEPYCFETDREERWYEIGCIDGIKAADAEPNLESLWHDASEEPNGNNWEILCVDVYNGCWVDSRVNALLLHNKWNEYVDIEQVKMWAYVNNLLPKGGEK